MIPALMPVRGAPWDVLPPGVHLATLAEVATTFATNAKRRLLYNGLLLAAMALRIAGCGKLYLDGSYVTAKTVPGDYDGCWDPAGMDPAKLDPVFLDFTNKRQAMKTSSVASFSIERAEHTDTNIPRFFSDRKIHGASERHSFDRSDCRSNAAWEGMMIYSDRQYQITRAELAKLEGALAAVPAAKGAEDWVLKAQADALQSQIADLQAEMAEYDMLKLGKVAFAETCSLAELPRVLVQARIARGLSQTDLAERLNMKPQQVQRYEATNYMSASLARLIEVAGMLDVKISESFEAAHDETSGAIFAWSDPNDVSWSRLPIKEMVKRKWLDVKPQQSPVEAVRNFFVQAAGPQFATALHRKKVRANNVPNEFALLAWQARVLYLAHQLHERNAIKPFELNDTWLSELSRLTRRKDGPRQARDLLAERGIALVIERHLPGTYLDGAAMLSAFGQPVVALTLRYDRLDNFWFVLFHELAHVFLHLMQGLRFDFFDEEEGDKTDRIEQEADAFALNTLIPESAWRQCLSRFVLTEEAVMTDAENLGIDASIIAGRIRKERNDYTLLTRLVGQDAVRKQLEASDGN